MGIANKELFRDAAATHGLEIGPWARMVLLREARKAIAGSAMKKPSRRG